MVSSLFSNYIANLTEVQESCEVSLRSSSQQLPAIYSMSNAIGSSRKSNPHRICYLRAVSLGYVTVKFQFFPGMVDTAQFDVDSEDEGADAGLMAIAPRPPTATSMSKRPPTALRTLEVRQFDVNLTQSLFTCSF